ncbi:MAG: nucleoside kinase [Bacteroidales bacterium]
MKNEVRIYCKNTNTFHSVPIGTSLIEIVELIGLKMPYKVIAARVNNKTEGLKFKVFNAKDIEFLDISSSSGMRCYSRSLCFILYKAINDKYKEAELRIEHPISRGYYFTINNPTPIGSHELNEIKKRMTEIVEEDIHFKRIEDQSEKVLALFKEQKKKDIYNLLKSTGDSYYSYYRLEDLADYYYGCLAPSTGYINMWDLQVYNGGFLLKIPNRENPNIMEYPLPQPKLLEVFSENVKFNKIIGLQNVGELNKAIAHDMTSDLIKLSEALHEKKIARIADEIAAKKEAKVILISGPSSSGKTTFAKRLSIQLMTNLIKPIAISLDDYFLNREDTPMDENGDHDFESLYALDLKTFNADLERILKGEKVELPTFNFETGKREYKGKYIELKENNMLLLEGIHALNPDLTPTIEDQLKFRIYVSALTTISLDDHNWIPTTDNRLLRRIIRDSKYRKYSAKDTISRWESVRRGEEKWIFPFQENADAMFNSALLFELPVIKNHAEPLLKEVPQNCIEYSEAYRLLKFLNYFKPIYEHEIPSTSLLREFLGGSSFRY